MKDPNIWTGYCPSGILFHTSVKMIQSPIHLWNYELVVVAEQSDAKLQGHNAGRVKLKNNVASCGGQSFVSSPKLDF
jgi:hypothetical protein